jgi:hypothetical protein
MAAFNLSPSVDWEERDYSLVATSKADVIGAIAGAFQWGPVEVASLITGGEDELFDKFGGTTNQLYSPYLVAADFLQYSAKMQVVRVVGDAARNAVPQITPAITTRLVKNDEAYERDLTALGIPFIGKYPGVLANNKIITFGKQEAFDSFEYERSFDYRPATGRAHVVVSDGATATKGSFSIAFTVDAGRSGDTTLTTTIDGVDVVATIPDTADLAAIHTEIVDAITSSPVKASAVASGDDLVVTMDEYFPMTHSVASSADASIGVTSTSISVGTAGDILEVYTDVELSNTGAVREDGSPAFVAEVMSGSNFVRAGEDATFSLDQYVMGGGVDDNGSESAPIDILVGLDALRNAEKVEFQFLISGNVSVANQRDASDLASSRRDCMTFVSPIRSAVFDLGNEVTEVRNWRNTSFNKASSYDVMDCNWAQVYDRRSKRNRWIPCCGGTAGLVARTWFSFNPWESPAFHNRGAYKGYRKLAWSPDKNQRDFLYKDQINPIVSMSGEGILLYGDKTGLAKDSAFGSINIRSLFIVVEKTIANLSKYYLGELNDEFTRSQFLNTVNPYLRSIKQRRGIEDFKVICDERNNTGQAVASKEFHANFLIKPAYSINFIKLSFAAVRPDISFEEIESQLYGE